MRQESGGGSGRPLGPRFGRALKVIRAQRGIQRKELAERAGLSYAYVSEIETGKKPPSSRALVALSDALGLRPHELMAFADELGEHAASLAPASASPGWFHDSSERLHASHYLASPIAPEADHAFSGRPASRRHDALLAELSDLAQKLKVVDLDLLLALARRLAESGNQRAR